MTTKYGTDRPKVAKKPKPPKLPPPVKRFLEVEIQVIARVAEKGIMTIEFETDRQASNMKYRLWTLCRSIEAYEPDHPLAGYVEHIMFKIKGRVLTLVDRRKGPEVFVLTKALEGRQAEDVPLSADPEEFNALPKDRETSVYDEVRNDSNEKG